MHRAVSRGVGRAGHRAGWPVTVSARLRLLTFKTWSTLMSAPEPRPTFNFDIIFFVSTTSNSRFQSAVSPILMNFGVDCMEFCVDSRGHGTEA